MYPQAAVDYLVSQGWNLQHGYNEYRWGGYLIWARIPVFIDGRADVYGDAFINEYVRISHIRKDWRALLDQYEVEYVLIESTSSLAVLLEETAEWEQVYEDGVAGVFVRSRN